MSLSDESAKLAARLEGLGAQIERTIQAGEVDQVPPADVTRLVSGAVKLYAAAVEESQPGTELVRVIDDTVSTTEAMVVACALLRAHNLNPFDLAIWFQRTAPARSRDASGA